MNGTRLWLVIPMMAGLIAAALVAGCGGDESDAGGESASSPNLHLIENRAITVGSDIPFPPFAQGDPPGYEGFDIDLINAVAEELDLETRIEDAPFDLILLGGRGQFDLSISAVKITPRREKDVDFSDPYFISSQGLLVREGSGIQSVDDITSDTIIGVENGTDGAAYADNETAASEVRALPSADDAFNALFNARVDAVIADGQTVEDAAEMIEGLEVAENFPTAEEYGIVLPEGNDALLRAVNAALQEVKDDGTLNELYEEYFGIEAPDRLLTVTHEAT
ncbi:MAG: transporter substrate-binding domain-containing protein [Actinomycetota bacterium]|nr:transporter substrate-binding domain-containing protein [Actinomycetota bacterium]